MVKKILYYRNVIKVNNEIAAHWQQRVASAYEGEKRMKKKKKTCEL
jgi:hypothetical protein